MRMTRRRIRHGWRLHAVTLAATLNLLSVNRAGAQAMAPPAPGQASAERIAAKTAPDVAAGRDLYLEVMLNGQRTSLIAHFRDVGGRLSATGKDLREVGIATDKLGAADTASIELDQIPGLRYQYDASRQTIDLQVPDAIRKPYTFDTRELAQTPNAAASRGFLINYDAFAQTDTNAQFALWSEERYFDPSGVLSNTGIAYLYRDLHRYVRYDTTWSTSNPATLSTTQFGDTISSSLDWSRSIRIGGFQWRSNFALRPTS
jgi:hypothetical protein